MKTNTLDDPFEAILEFLEDECDFQASSYERSYLKRRVKARLRRTDPTDYEAYYDLLVADNEEQAELVDALSINVTKFFRNPDVWDALRPYLRDLVDDRGSVRFWSAACADGREPYSLAMLAADDPAIDESIVEILATDIDRGALEDARAGRYRQMRTANIEEQLDSLSSIDPYMDRREDAFTVRPSIQHMVEFEHHDLVGDDPPGMFDLVMCRNLLIYIESEAKRTILETLVDAVRPGGYLVIGMSETIPRDLRDGLEPADRSNRIYRRC